MTDHQILFTAPMVRALLDGRKTQTRRVAKLPLKDRDFGCELAGNEIGPKETHRLCPYGQPGDRLWVRETFAETSGNVWYRADPGVEDCVACSTPGWKWRPSIFMPRWASRISLEITGIRIDRLQDISETDALAEGISTIWPDGPREDKGQNHYTIKIGNVSYNAPTAAGVYRMLWEQINGSGSWAVNPWIWVLEFRRI